MTSSRSRSGSGRLTAATAQRRLLVLSATRWFPVGLIVGLTTLLMVEREMSLSDIGLIFATQGFVVLALELPTEAPNSFSRGNTPAGAARWRLENLSATNPVVVNGRPLDANGGVTSSVILSEGDRIEMGEVAFVFRER